MATPSEILNASTQEENERGLLYRFFAMRRENRERRREQQIAEALRGLDELKAQNAIYPTEKRTEAIKQLEENLRMNGILK